MHRVAYVQLHTQVYKQMGILLLRLKNLVYTIP